jgi:branched-chain amino acid transport system permease protein
LAESVRGRFPERISWITVIFWAIGILAIVLIVLGSFKSIASGRLTGARWRDLIVFGLAQGGIYGLIALGYTMVYGILGFINFAHGEVFTSGAMVGFFVARALDNAGLWDGQPALSLLILLLVCMATSTIVAILVERIAYRPLRDAPRLIMLITSIGASFFLQYTFRGLFGAGIKAYPRMDALEGFINIFGVRILKSQALVIVAALVMMVGLYLFVERTKVGKSLRAVAEDKEIAALMGIDVDRTIVMTFAVGGAMAGAAALLYVLVFGQVYFLTGFFPGIKAFTAAVLGGIGNLVGAMFGGVVLGILESVGPSLVLAGFNIPAFTQLKDVVAFLALVLVLILRPTGLLGERLAEERA